MTYNTIGNYTPNNTADFFVYSSDVVPSLFPLILFAFFAVTTLGTYFMMFRRSTNPNFLVCFIAGSVLTFLLAVLFSLIPGLISGVTLYTWFGVMLVSIIIAFMQGTD